MKRLSLVWILIGAVLLLPWLASSPVAQSAFSRVLMVDSSNVPVPLSTGGSGTIDSSTGRVTIATDDPVNDFAVKGDANMVASGASDAGNPLKIGGYASTDLPTAVTAGQRANAWFNLRGAQVMQMVDPCSGVKVPVSISIATGTTTQFVAASSGNYVHICSLNLGPTAGAQNFALVEDDTAACASPTAGMAGGTTSGTGWNFPANGGLAFGSGIGTIAQTATTNRYVCGITSASQQVSGVMMYVLAPY